MEEDAELMQLVAQEVEDFQRLALGTDDKHPVEDASMEVDLENAVSMEPCASVWASNLRNQTMHWEQSSVHDKLNQLQTDIHAFSLQSLALHQKQQQPQHLPGISRLAIYNKRSSTRRRRHLRAAQRQLKPNWSSHIVEELRARQRSEADNMQLKQLVGQQVVLAHQMRAMVQERVQRDASLWRMYCVLQESTNMRKKLLSSRVRETQVLFQSPDVLLKYVWLMRRMEFSLQQTDLVFQNHPIQTIPQQMLQAVNGELLPFHQLKIRCGQDCVEMMGSTVTCFDADTLLNLLWTCFAWNSRVRRNSSSCDEWSEGSSSSSSSSSPSRGRELKRKRCHQEQIKSITSLVNYDNQIEKRLVGDEIHWKSDNLEITTTASRIRCSTRFEYCVFKRFRNVLLGESFGEASVLAAPTLSVPLPYTRELHRTAWFRVDPLPDGRSVLHHVNRVTPAHGCFREFEKNLASETLQQSHYDLSIFVKQVVLQHFLQKRRIRENGWPLQGTLM